MSYDTVARGRRSNDAILSSTVVFKRGRRLGSGPNWLQAKPSLAKQIQTKLLGFAWFYSSESGLFNGLRMKK